MHDQSWLVVVVEVIELFNNLLHFSVNAFVVVSSKVEYDLAAWVFTKNAAEELVKTDQMAMGTVGQSLDDGSTLMGTFGVESLDVSVDL